MMSQSDLVELQRIATEFRAAARRPRSPIGEGVELAQLRHHEELRAAIKPGVAIGPDDMPLDVRRKPTKWAELADSARMAVALYTLAGLADIENPVPILDWPCEENWGRKATDEVFDYWRAMWVMRLPVQPTRYADEWRARMAGTMAVKMHEANLPAALASAMWDYVKPKLANARQARDETSVHWYEQSKAPAVLPGVHPTETIIASLRMIAHVCRECKVFRVLADVRARAKEQRAKSLKFHLDFTEFATLAMSPLPDAPAATLSMLEGMAKVGMAHCEAVQEAIRKDGGRALDRSREGAAAFARSDVYAACLRAGEHLRRLRDSVREREIEIDPHVIGLMATEADLRTWADALDADTTVYGFEGPMPTGEDATRESIRVAADKLWKAQARALYLADAVEKLQRADAAYPEFFAGYYSVPSSLDDDRKADEAFLAYPANAEMVRLRGVVIDWVSRTRGAIDAAIVAVGEVAPSMDGLGNACDTWSFQAIDDLRRLRGSIGGGMLPDLAATTDNLRKRAAAVVERCEQVKTVMLRRDANASPAKQGVPVGVNVEGLSEIIAQAVTQANQAVFGDALKVKAACGETQDATATIASEVPMPPLRRRDREVYQAYMLLKLTQKQIAAKFQKQYPKERWSQGRVSEAIKRAKLHAKACGADALLQTVASRAPARTLDPTDAELGRRTDGRAAHIREKMRDIEREDD